MRVFEKKLNESHDLMMECFLYCCNLFFENFLNNQMSYFSHFLRLFFLFFLFFSLNTRTKLRLMSRTCAEMERSFPILVRVQIKLVAVSVFEQTFSLLLLLLLLLCDSRDNIISPLSYYISLQVFSCSLLHHQLSWLSNHIIVIIVLTV